MRNTIIVIKHEIITTLGKRSFWIMTFLFPLVILGLSIGMQTIGTRAIEQAEEEASSIDRSAATMPIGYVDEVGILDSLPSWVPEGYLKSFPDRETAKSALESGEINQYYIIPASFYASGNYTLIDKNFQPLRSSGNAEIFENILSEQLIAKDPLGEVIHDPTSNINGHALAPPSGPDEDDPFAFVVPLATLFIFFFVITTSSGFLLTSVTKEKESQTAETLLVSLDPKQLMTGKIIGLGAVALLQMSVWLGGAIFALNNRNQLFDSASSFNLPSGFIFWAILFFIFGYFLYASILGAVGVLAPTAREGGQFTFVAILPLLVPLWFNYVFTESPNGPVAIFLSLFPLTAPSSMMSRLTNGNVPLWQLIVSLLALALTAYLIMMFSARLFSADNLLSTESISWGRVKSEFGRRKQR
jgi:ABC-2 type transport system permease protein